MLILLAVITWLALKPDYFIWKIVALLALAPRINTIEKERFEKISKNPSILTKVGFIYMLGWLVYILYVYFQSPSNTEHILSRAQLLLFILPIFTIFLISEIKWYFVCNEPKKP